LSDAQTRQQPVFYRLDVAKLTRMTAPRYGTITYTERNGQHVLSGPGDLLLIGPMGINYHIEGSDDSVIYLRRWDQKTLRSNGPVTILQTLRGASSVRTYKGHETTPAPPYPERPRPRRRPRP
jgi:hypothetical protein